MPFVNVKLIAGVFTVSQKQEMIRKLTDAMVSVEGENLRPVTWVVIEEVASGAWGVGGTPLTTNDVQALAAGKSNGRHADGESLLSGSKPPRECG